MAHHIAVSNKPDTRRLFFRLRKQKVSECRIRNEFQLRLPIKPMSGWVSLSSFLIVFASPSLSLSCSIGPTFDVQLESFLFLLFHWILSPTGPLPAKNGLGPKRRNFWGQKPPKTILGTTPESVCRQHFIPMSWQSSRMREHDLQTPDLLGI